jgi:hypothetical protein
MMKSTPLVNMSVDGFLGIQARNRSYNGSGDTDSKSSVAGPLIGGSTGGFIIFVFTCIAATHSNSDSIYSACGHTLRNLLIADLVMPVVLIVVVLLVALVAWLVGWNLVPSNSRVGNALKTDAEAQAALNAAVNSAFYIAIASLIFLSLCCISMAVGAACLGGFSISESVIAMSNSDCMSAMSNTTDGINSPSANTGSPLLAIMAIIQGIVYCFAALGFTLGFVLFIVDIGAQWKLSSRPDA